MVRNTFDRFTQTMVVIGLATVLSASALAGQGTDRSTSELEKDLRTTKQEFKKFQSLESKLKSAAKQSSNTARETAVHNFQDFMGDCIKRREGELSEVMTLKQHGEMVKPGTSKVSEVGSPVPVKKAGKGVGIYNTTDGDRLRQLTNMKSIYVSAKNNSRPAIEKQAQAFERYTETIAKFGQQLEWAVNGLTQELDRRDAEEKAKNEKKAEED
jgi:hypothetical protein